MPTRSVLAKSGLQRRVVRTALRFPRFSIPGANGAAFPGGGHIPLRRRRGWQGCRNPMMRSHYSQNEGQQALWSWRSSISWALSKALFKSGGHGSVRLAAQLSLGPSAWIYWRSDHRGYRLGFPPGDVRKHKIACRNNARLRQDRASALIGGRLCEVQAQRREPGTSAPTAFLRSAAISLSRACRQRPSLANRCLDWVRGNIGRARRWRERARYAFSPPPSLISGGPSLRCPPCCSRSRQARWPG